MGKKWVASFTDAWIETNCSFVLEIDIKSHLLQMRGLKRYHINEGKTDREVASFTDAWIETFITLSATTSILVASFTDAWIETPSV